MVAYGEEHRGGALMGNWEKEVVSDGPGATLIRYTAPDENGEPQIKLEVAAMTEEHDLDGGGDGEIVVYHTGKDTRGIGIYDLAYGKLVCLDVNEALGCQASEYAGNIGNIRREYGNCVEDFFTDPDGSRRAELYRYTPARRLEYVCPLEKALQT